MTPELRLLTVEDAAAEAGIHPATVWRYLSAGVLKRHVGVMGVKRRTFVDVDKLRELRSRTLVAQPDASGPESSKARKDRTSA